MNPLHILAWIAIGVLALIAICVALFVASVLFRTASLARTLRRRHLESRKIPPAVGQVWLQGDSRLEITRVTDDHVCVRVRRAMSTGSWCDTRAEWDDRVTDRMLILEQE